MTKDNANNKKNHSLTRVLQKNIQLLIFLLVLIFCLFWYSKQPEKLDLVKFIKENGYPVEEHEITTEDGYLLTVYRIPHGINSSETNGRPVLVNHGLMESAGGYLILGPKRGLGFILADKGYDVWLMNCRGNSYSNKHLTIDESNKSKFYNFSYHEIGLYDIPACILYVLKETNQEKLHYIGHSQGTTTFFVMGSLRPEFNRKIRLGVMLSPVALGTNVSILYNAISPYLDSITTVMNQFNIYDTITVVKLMRQFFKYCDYSVIQPICVRLCNLLGGYADPGQFDVNIIPTMALVTPSNIALKQFTHFIQCLRLKIFSQYDYGEKINLKAYGTSDPPPYELERVDAPMALYIGKNDQIADLKDFYLLIRTFKNLTHTKIVPYDDWNHLDFLYAKEVVKYLYNDVVQTMDMY